MYDLKFCRICLDHKLRMHKISGSEVQDVYERLTNIQFQEDVLYYTCYTCYSQLLKCKQLVTKLQKSKELLKHILTINNELNLNSITLQDRYTHGLVHSLTVTNTESLQTPEDINNIKTENQDESDNNNEQMIKNEPYEDSTSPNVTSNLDEKHNFEQDEAISIQIVKQEYVPGYQTNTEANDNMLSQIVCDEKSKPGSVMNDENCFICNDCGEPCDTKALLVSHTRRHTSVISKPNNGKYTECDSFKEDFDIHAREKPFKCQYCNYTFKKQAHLKSHIRIHTGEKPFKCHYCRYAFTTNSTLTKHIRIHTGEKPFKCNYCSYAFRTNSTLKKHIRIHTGEKPYKCQYCCYTCIDNGGMIKHIRTHTGEKPYKCQYCSYTCIDNGGMKKHIRTHTGEKPYKCQYCNNAFAQNTHLKTHIRIHTGEKPFKCHYCSYTCIDNGSFKRHMRTHTGEKTFKC